MILPNLIIASKVNQTYQILGHDCVEESRNPDHWLKYNKPVTYTFNSRGFRDEEWPEDINNAIWCFGDSFTLGMGQPQNEIWPKLLQTPTAIRTINISMNGASNDWIARKVIDLLSVATPRAICIQWSFLHRRELNDPTRSDESRSLHFDADDTKDLENFFKNVDMLPANKNIVHSWIPNFCWVPKRWVPNFFNNESKRNLDMIVFDEMSARNLTYITDNQQIDFARDYHHYDIKTAQKYVDHYIEKLGASTWD